MTLRRTGAGTETDRDALAAASVRNPSLFSDRSR